MAKAIRNLCSGSKRKPRLITVLTLLRSAERGLGLRLCYHDYLRRFELPFAYTVHESSPCLRNKEIGRAVCHQFCGADGEVDRTILRHPDGWLHHCPYQRQKIALPVRYAGGLAGVLFAELHPRQDGLSLTESSRKVNAGGVTGEKSRGLKRWGGDLVERTLNGEELGDRRILLCGVARQLEAMIRGEPDADGGNRQEKILRYVEETLDRPADLAGLGKVLNLSASRAGHLVRELFDRSFRSLALEARANRAALLVSTTELGLSEIALRLGFTDQSHLTRVFRQHTGETPAAYRRRRCTPA